VTTLIVESASIHIFDIFILFLASLG